MRKVARTWGTIRTESRVHILRWSSQPRSNYYWKFFDREQAAVVAKLGSLMKSLTLAAILLLTALATAQSSGKPKTKLTPAEILGVSGTRSLRDMLNDPESFRVTSVRIVSLQAILGATDSYDPNVLQVCIEGRAKNATGGYVSLLGLALGILDKGIAVGAKIGNPAGDEDDAATATTIAKFCNDPGIDVTNAAKAALKTDRDKE